MVVLLSFFTSNPAPVLQARGATGGLHAGPYIFRDAKSNGI